MKKTESIKTAKRFYREIKNLAASQSTCSYFGRFLRKFKRNSIAWHALKQLAEQHKRVDVIQERLVSAV
jgi:hypothetical protein